MSSEKERIFVQIAAYRDEECQWTIKDLFERARHPERIFVGVCWQSDPERDHNCFLIPTPRPEQVRSLQVHPDASQGAGWARNQAQSLWRGEEYVLQIHAHMRFEDGWDETLIAMLGRTGREESLISSYVPRYDPPRKLPPAARRVMRVKVNKFGPEDDPQIIHLTGHVPRKNDKRAAGLYRSPFWVGNFLFAPSRLLREVPNDPHIYFYGEEIAYSARLWTHGWDIYQPDVAVIYHQWDRKATISKQHYRRMSDARNQRSLHRVKHLLGLESSNDLSATQELEKYGLGSERPLKDFWLFAGIGPRKRTIREEAKEGVWELPAQYGALTGEAAPARPRIFVQIASYRDPECQWTVKNLFEKAAHPDRIFVGICWQADREEDKDCFLVPPPRPEQVRELHVHWSESKGAGWARQQAQTLWQGEDYVLHIHAHMLFEPGWDEALIDMLGRCPSAKPVLTGWLPYYTPPDHKHPLNGTLPKLFIDKLDRHDGQIVNLLMRSIPEQEVQDRTLMPTPCWVGNFSFSRAGAFNEVPFDPLIYFWGEELSFSARLWTHGYDMFQPDRVVLYHYWDRGNPKDAASYRPLENPLNRRSRARLGHMLGLQVTHDPEALYELHRYGLGTKRRLADYWEYAGIDVKNWQLLPKAKSGDWELYRDPPHAEANERIFVQIAAFRDPECEHTVHDLFAKAAHPERVTVGICWQSAEGDAPLFSRMPTYSSQVKVVHVDAAQSQGANWARSMAISLWQGEEYVWQIDSHMRFLQGWDEALIASLRQCESDNAVITMTPALYRPPNELEDLKGELPFVQVGGFGADEGDQPLHLTAIKLKQADVKDTLLPSAFVVACSFFTRAEVLREVPNDPHIFFYGDELSLSARLWTHGYDFYQPTRLIAYHYWELDYGKKNDYKRSRHPANARSVARVRHLLGIKKCSDAQALYKLEQYGLGKARSLNDYWDYAGVNPVSKKISANAKKGQWKAPAGKKAAAPVQRKPTARPGHETIFVQIASYRDPECQWTVKDLFEKAAHPERITVGICWQFVKGEDDQCFEVPYPFPKQVKVIEVNAHEGKGVCWARGLVQSLYAGEDYTMQIDSHMRFEQGWDDTFISMHKQCENPKSVLTAYPPGYTPPDKLETGFVLRMIAKEFDRDGIFLMTSTSVDQRRAADSPYLGAFCSACFYFGPGSMIADVPYDPSLYFFGEEITLAVRLWTHGYDLYHPQRTMVYHDWNRGRRTTHFDDHKNWGKLNDVSFRRVKHMLGTETSTDPQVLKDLDRFGLGKERSLEDYQYFSGVNFARKTIARHAFDGDFSGAADRSKNRAGNGRIFVQIASYRDRECQWTVKDLFEKAAHPENITVGICWQFDEAEDQDCFQVSTRADQVKVFPVDWRESEGVCWARHIVQQMWDGEEFSLQIDAHMRFVPGWDQLMIQELAACDSPKPVLSCNPASYTPPNNLSQQPRPTVRRVQFFDAQGNLRGKGEPLQKEPPTPLNGAFVAAGFVFARSEILAEVPYDPHLAFDQEEATYAARLYTHGWDIFSARSQFLYHYYNDAKSSVRPLFWSDMQQANPGKLEELRTRGIKRFDHLFGYATTAQPDAIKDLSKYGFGKARTLEEYQHYCGVDFKRKHVSEKALRCLFVRGLEKYRPEPIFIPELDADKVNATQGSSPIALRPIHTPAVPAMLPEFPKTGDRMPMFILPDQDGQPRALDLYAGQPVALFFIPAQNEEYVQRFFAQMKTREKDSPQKLWQLFVLDAEPVKLQEIRKKYDVPHALWADAQRSLLRSFALVNAQNETRPAALLLDARLRVVQAWADVNPASLVNQTVAAAEELLATQAETKPCLASAHAPVLMIPGVLTPELRQRCLESFRTGRTFDGTVGAGGGGQKGYRPNAKLRTDHVIEGELLEMLDAQMARVVFPEIMRAFGYDISFRERYKVGRYSAEKEGFFAGHRDNFEPGLGYRRLAMSLALNDDYEGGGLRFSEYGNDLYKPDAGDAIVFSSALMHEVEKVRKGDRYVLVGHFFCKEDEAYRRHFVMKDGRTPNIENFVLRTRREWPGVDISRSEYELFMQQHSSFDGGNVVVPPAFAGQVTEGSAKGRIRNPVVNIALQQDTQHRPRKVFESKEGIIFDDFLPEKTMDELYDFVVRSEFEYINNKKVARAWHVHDQHPLRSDWNMFYQAQPDHKSEGLKNYPTGTPVDRFVEQIIKAQPSVDYLLGKARKDWDHFTVTAWLYQQGTGLAMHDDGAGVYAGAYAFFMNKVWKPHWGGLLLLVDEEANTALQAHKKAQNGYEYHMRGLLHANRQDEFLMETGFAQCVMPKRNRIVFIAPDAYHMVTHVLPMAGDNIRTSLAGFFTKRPKENKQAENNQGGQYD